MEYVQFQIENFKGIRSATIPLATTGIARVFTFVGLNESGKTTILEAIHSFSPDAATSELVGGDDVSGVPIRERVPRHVYSDFSGDVVVAATARFLHGERERAIRAAEVSIGGKINESEVGDTLTFSRKNRFRNGDFVSSFFTLETMPTVKTGKQKKWRKPNSEERGQLRNTFYGFTPDIAYFPTFVFNFPDKIYLTKERDKQEGRLNTFYRQCFQDLLDYEGRGQTIEQNIVSRIRNDRYVVDWSVFLPAWLQADDRDKIQQVIDRASAVVTKVIFGRWNQIFGEDASGKEIIIPFDATQGEVTDSRGVTSRTDEHDLFVRFQIKDGTKRYAIKDRSLGFRWFFAFMLFTQFRVARESTRPVFFLFDEPASNLHAAAQQKLIESFPEIAKAPHTLAYTTHSHYMIEPKWLEQTLIVTNRADTPSQSVIDAAIADDESLDVKATPYRRFANDNPSSTSYFQPIIDRLSVVPSRFDIARSSILLEGKSDYYILRYAANLIGKADLPLIPCVGSGTMQALTGLHLGWGIPTLLLLDSDKQGQDERTRYEEEFGLPSQNLVSLGDIKSGLVEIEGILDNEAKKSLAEGVGIDGKLTKNQIRRAFQERLAANDVRDLGTSFKKAANQVLNGLEQRLAALTA